MKFTYTILSLSAAKAEDGNGFAGRGDWVLLKCFYEEGDQYGEFFLNLNINTKEGELSPKEGYYSEVLVEAFQKSMVGEVENLEGESSEEAEVEKAPVCPIHKVEMVKQTGKFGSFWSCHKRNQNGKFCSYRPKD